MKKRINACVLLGIALLFSAFASAVPAAVANNDQIAQLLDQLGVRALLEQTPALLAAAIDAEAQFQQTPAQPLKPSAINARRDLEAQLKPQLLLQDVTRFLRERYRADTFNKAQQRLQEPLAKRARYFDLAMTQPGAEKNLREFLLQNGLAPNETSGNQDESSRKSDKPLQNSAVTDRLVLLRDIDTASAGSSMMATLQSAIAARVQQTTAGGAIDTALLTDAIAERQRYLAPLATNYLLYDYRYLRDDELRDYRDLLRDEAVQWLLDVSRQAVLAAIVGEIPTPPPNPPQ